MRERWDPQGGGWSVSLGTGTFFGDELGRHPHLEGAEDRRVVAGDNVVCAPCGQSGWGGVSLGWGGGQPVPGAGGGQRPKEGDTQLTVGIAVDVSLGVGLPEDAVAPGGHVGADLAGTGVCVCWGCQAGVPPHPNPPPPPSTYPCGLLLVPDVGVPGAPLVAVGGGEGDLLLTCTDSGVGVCVRTVLTVGADPPGSPPPSSPSPHQSAGRPCASPSPG